MRKIAIIGGTGVYSPDALGGFEEKVIKTPYGDALCKMGSLYGNQVVFITRHGAGHSVPPHKVNYRANIWALKSLGTEEIFATTAVGSLNKEMKAGHFVVCDQAIDFTKSRVMLGGDLVGMTNIPESVLAREAEMCYTNCSIVTNMAAGISPTPLSHSEVVEAMAQSGKNMAQLIEAFIADNSADETKCGCEHCMAEFGGFKL